MRARTAAFLLSILVSACTIVRPIPPGPPGPPPPPPPPAAIAFDLVACRDAVADNYCNGPANAKLTVTPSNGDTPRVQMTDGNGYAYVTGIPATWNNVHLTFEAKGFKTFEGQFSTVDWVNTNKAGQHNFFGLTIIPPPTPTWTKAQLMDMQTDLMLWAPEVGCLPEANIRCEAGAVGLQAGWVWSLTIPRYRPENRDRLYQAAKRRGYTHLALHVPQCVPNEGYHGLTPETCPPDYDANMNATMREMIAHNIIPICAGVAPDAPVAPGLDRSLCKVVMTDWDNSAQAACRIQSIAEAFPNALLYYELPSGNVIPDPSPCDSIAPTSNNGGAWIRSMQQRYPNFVGVLYEVDYPLGLDRNAADINARHAWWRDLQEVQFEIDTYWKFWGDHGALNDDTMRQYNDNLHARVPYLAGFGSGSSTHPPIPDGGGTSGDMAAGDMIDVGSIVWTGGPNLGSFARTSTIQQLQLRTTGVHVDFDKKDGAGRWPDNTTPGWEGPLQYSIGMVLKVNGTWYGSAPIELWYGLDESGGQIQAQTVPLATACPGGGQVPNNWFYDARWGALHCYQPKPGEQIGMFVVAGDPRNNFTPVTERSNVVLIPLPTDGVPATFSLKR